ncbi:S9 family peptidase [Marihabitans asiaticum]|uniref:Oligopeptidase B n=1 Tax=Marihabitans asiaticum TaxID=415218 RepID=A0A560WAB6_9MICO|nr:S9 family peptidase [Marihabitans asiaticum]TWD14490.1 oligopeptidase B [Marihabitans asiaticum]
MGEQSPARPTPPVARTGSWRREHHGQVFEDPYEWLRDGDSAEVLEHLRAENAYAEAMTDHLEPVRQEIVQEIRSRTLETDLTVPMPAGPWWYYTRTVEGLQYGIHCRAPLRDRSDVPDLEPGAALPGEQVLLDENAVAEGHDFFALGAFEVSPDHTRLAYSVDTAGDERFDVVVLDIASGEVLDDAISGAGYGAVFSRDGSHLFTVRVDQAWRPYQVWRHEVGSAASGDVLVHQEDDERFWMGIAPSRDDRWVVIALGSRTTSETHLIDADDPTGPARCVSPREEGVEYEVEPAADHLLITHNRRHREWDLSWAPLDSTSSEDWQPLLERVDGERFLHAEAYDDFAVLSLRKDGVPAARVLPRTTRSAPFAGSDYAAPHDLVVSEDPMATLGLIGAADPDTDRVRVTHESWVSPRTVLDVVVATGEQVTLKQQPVLGVDLKDYEQRREWVSAEDGTTIPLSIVTRRGVVPDGSNPGWLTGYGSYEISLDPYFSIARLSLLDRGVVYAVAHVRGGGEMGRAWYEDGRLERKQNTFTDFVDCGRHLVESGWVAQDRLAAEGGSAGGLLVGAAANLAPQLWRSVLAAVPFVDALTTILRPELPLTVGEWDEWGDPLHHAEVYDYMRGYSPYENVAATAYPAILATTSLNDTRVSFTEPAKWVARLRDLTTNDPATAPILLRTEMVAGHGGRSGRYAAWEQTAWEWAWQLDQIGACTVG